MPAYVRPTYGGGATVSIPGQVPVTISPTYDGGATIYTPGQLPTRVSPTYGGGYTVMRPGELPVFIRPSSGSTTTSAVQVATYFFPVTKAKETDKKNTSKMKK
jgi:hypothetical protein